MQYRLIRTNTLFLIACKVLEDNKIQVGFAVFGIGLPEFVFASPWSNRSISYKIQIPEEYQGLKAVQAIGDGDGEPVTLVIEKV